MKHKLFTLSHVNKTKLIFSVHILFTVMFNGLCHPDVILAVHHNRVLNYLAESSWEDVPFTGSVHRDHHTKTNSAELNRQAAGPRCEARRGLRCLGKDAAGG